MKNLLLKLEISLHWTTCFFFEMHKTNVNYKIFFSILNSKDTRWNNKDREKRLFRSITVTFQWMSFNVPVEIWAITAKLTKVAFLLGMADHMLFKFAICFKFFIALGTLEWFFICMGSNMIGQRILANVFFPAKIAFERNFLCMMTHMSDKICTIF